LATYQFPELNFNYTKIILTYETDVHSAADNPTAEKGSILKNGYGQWGDVTAENDVKYPAFAASGTFTWDLELFPHASGGFGIQHNADGGKADGWLLRATKIEFTTQDLIDSGAEALVKIEITEPVLEILGGGGNATQGTIALNATTGVISVNNKQTQSNLGFSIDLPAKWKEYTTIAVDYDITFTGGTETVRLDEDNNVLEVGDEGYDEAEDVVRPVGNLAKFTTKVGKAMTVDTQDPMYSADITTDGTGTFTVPVARMLAGIEKHVDDGKTLPTDMDAVSFQINSWSGTVRELLMIFDMEITKVTLTP
jgi:hypothetical protein